MADDNLENLEVKTQKRQAIPPLRGYDYQIWQSLNRWISLTGSEVLFLEGAEDFDVLRKGEAETIQVKETARTGTVTLNTQKIIEAIAHFWEHQKNNPGYAVRFRFLTTSERGFEQSNSFCGLRGLDYWDQCKRPNVDLEPLRLFLSSHEGLPSDLRDFVATVSDDELREKLITQIEWDTGQKDKAYIEELITQRVIHYGVHVHALQHSESVKIVPQLFKYVWSVILQEENRRLTYGDFTRLFEEYSTIRIPRRAMQLREMSLSMISGTGLEIPMGMGETAHGVVTETNLKAYALPSFDKLAQREKLVTELQGRLDNRGFLVLTGSSGMG
jgi:hypothetical protein